MAEVVSEEQYGSGGPPKELTWREIEDLGQAAGQLASRTIDAAIQGQHNDHFQQAQVCPQCSGMCEPGSSKEREFLTRHGGVTVNEFANSVSIVTLASVLFFPQRVVLRIDGR